MTANIVRFPGVGLKSPTEFPSRSPSARCQWLIAEVFCQRRAFYAVDVTALGKGPLLVCTRHLDVALQQAVVAPGPVHISPLVIDRSCWHVARWAWGLAHERRHSA